MLLLPPPALTLLAGKPTLQLPIFLEQAMFVRQVCRLGAGLQASIRNPEQIVQRLAPVLESEEVAEGARAFAARYMGFDAAGENEMMVVRIEH